jgi:hypothetical protein
MKAVERVATRFRAVVQSCRYLLMRRLKFESFGERKKVSPFTWDRIREVADIMITHPAYYTDERYRKIIDLLRIIERGIWAMKNEQDLRMTFDVELVRILSDTEPVAHCQQCGKQINGEPVTTAYHGRFCTSECARDFTED